jgi:sugar O-acyltransferase (sialic acid O-acetyltransferase NeuD family)
MKDLILIGGGGHCKSVIDVIETGKAFNIVGILDMPEKIGEKILGYEIIGEDENIKELSRTVKNFFISLGQINTGQFREKLFRTLKMHDLTIPTIISPYAYVSESATVGEGTIIMHHALLNAGSRIGNNCIINSKALIEHDVSVADHCHISTGAILNGGVIVNHNSFIGSKAVCIQNTVVPKHYFLKAASLYKGLKNNG